MPRSFRKMKQWRDLAFTDAEFIVSWHSNSSVRA
jgi:hypothetical protein